MVAASILSSVRTGMCALSLLKACILLVQERLLGVASIVLMLLRRLDVVSEWLRLLYELFFNAACSFFFNAAVYLVFLLASISLSSPFLVRYEDLVLVVCVVSH